MAASRIINSSSLSNNCQDRRPDTRRLSMSNVCILTDSSVQFTCPDFPGHERVYVIPFGFQEDQQHGDETQPRSNLTRRLVPPSLQEFIRFYAELSRKYDTIFVIALSSLLNPTYETAISASKQHSNHAIISVVDSQTTGIGLGLLVQAGAAAANAGALPPEIEQRMRAIIPHIYMLLCIPELAHLAHSGFLEYSQAMVAEMLGILPIFVIEEGRLIPVGKVRTQRHLFESILEFINEFDAPAHIALTRGRSANGFRSRPVRQYVRETFPEAPFSEHVLTPQQAALFGPESTGLVIMEKVE
jgi:DegV family protein with EDD domain